MSESEEIDLLIEIFGWKDSTNDPHVRFKTLQILRFHRGQLPPTWDDFQAGVVR